MDVSRKGASTTSWKPLPLTSIPDKKQLSRIRNGCAARGSCMLTHSDDASNFSKKQKAQQQAFCQNLISQYENKDITLFKFHADTVLYG